MSAVPPAPASPTHARVVAELERARAATHTILGPIPDEDQRRQVSVLMSPLCWDLAHVAHYEELWLLRALGRGVATDPRFDDLYDAFRHPRRDRVDLPILDPGAARAFAAEVRRRVIESIGGMSFTPDDPLLRDGFVYGMVVQHEHQHDETMLATIQLMGEDLVYPHCSLDAADDSQDGLPDVEPTATCTVEGGLRPMGTDTEVWSYDNERPAHTVDVATFVIDRYPVTNGRFAEFVADGGYDDPRLWTDAGWAWRCEAGLGAPQFWRAEGGGTWSRVRFGRREAVPPREPVQHVCWYEADAFARWSDARLPTEAEWEAAAEGATRAGANLGLRRCGPSPIGSHPTGASRWGVEHCLGDVWEWTASRFTPYPGFRSFPYREYSEVFFGDEYTVLRGGSWATDPLAIRVTFRNWDFPIRRQIFAGFRCARDWR